MKKVIQIDVLGTPYYVVEINDSLSEVSKDLSQAKNYAYFHDGVLEREVAHVKYYYGASVVSVAHVSATPGEAEIEAQAKALFPNSKELQSSFILGAYHTIYYGEPQIQ